MIIEYIMKKKDTQKLVLKGISEHCFLDKAGKPIRLSKEFSEFDNKLKDLAQKSV